MLTSSTGLARHGDLFSYQCSSTFRWGQRPGCLVGAWGAGKIGAQFQPLRMRLQIGPGAQVVLSALGAQIKIEIFFY